MGKGMQGFWKGLMEDEDARFREGIEGVQKVERERGEAEEVNDGEGQSDKEFVNEMRARGIDVKVNDEGQIIDKRELLSAGLNVAP